MNMQSSEPFEHYSISNRDTGITVWEGADAQELMRISNGCKPASEYSITVWFGLDNENDEITHQVSVDEWLHFEGVH